MATLIATADGVLTAAATWGVVETTSLLDDETGNFAVATAASWSSGAAFTPGVVTIDGLAVKIATRAASPSGTFSVRIYNVTGGAAVAGTTVTVNVSDILSAAALHNGFMFFKFAAPVALAAATNYRVEAQTSAASQVNLYRNATANNMARMLRTTTTAAPGAGDRMFVLGEWTAAATKTNRTVTMDSTAATDYGSASTTVAGFGISNGGTVSYGTTAATNYVLRLSAIFDVWIGGTFNMGTTGTPIPRDGSAVLEFDCSADDDFTLRVWGTSVMQGLSRTSGKDVVACLLGADEAAGQTVLTVDRDTGWLANDEIAILSTTRTQTQSESRTLSINATASEVTVTAGLTNAHGGADPYQAAVLLLTRNVMVRAVNSGFSTGVKVGASGDTNWDWVDFRYCGAASSTKGLGVEFLTTTPQTLGYCIFRDGDDNGWTVTGAGANVTFTHCAAYRATTVSTGYAIGDNNNVCTITLTDCWIGGNSTLSQGGVSCQGGVTLTLTRVRIQAVMTGILASNVANIVVGTDVVVFNAVTGINVNGAQAGYFNGLDVIRCSGGGILLQNGGGPLTFIDARIIGNAGQGVLIQSVRIGLTFYNTTFAGDSSFAQPCAVNTGTGNSFYQIEFHNCTFGVASGSFVAHSDGDFDASSTPQVVDFLFDNCVLASPTEFTAGWLTVMTQYFSAASVIRYQRDEGVTATHLRYYPSLGTVAYETTTYRTASPAEKMTPSGAVPVVRLHSSVKRIALATGQIATIGVYVRKDGSYTGSAPRLILKANASLGIDNDVVLDTMAGGSGIWEQLTGSSSPVAEEDGVLECYVDCDGSAGNVFVDDWSATIA